MPRWKRTFESPCEDDAYITYHYAHFLLLKRLLRFEAAHGNRYFVHNYIQLILSLNNDWSPDSRKLTTYLPTKDRIVYSKEHDLCATVLCERTGRLPCQFIEKGKSKLVKTSTKRIMWYAASRDKV